MNNFVKVLVALALIASAIVSIILLGKCCVAFSQTIIGA